MSRIRPASLTSLFALAALSACATSSEPAEDAPFVAAVLAAPPPPTVAAVTLDLAEISPPIPLPPSNPPSPEAREPTTRVARANEEARVEPTRDGYLNAVQVYAYDEGALFQVYAAPGQITDIALQPGETLAPTGPVAAGDTVRWIIGDTVSGSGPEARVHVLVKPTRPNLRTNLIINTDRRTYHVELRSTASTYMASVSWRYPQDELIALAAASTKAAQQAAEPRIDLDALDFRYRVTGPEVAWHPERVFDDGRQVFIEFGEGLASASLPPLFVRGPDGRSADLVNYRVAGRRIIVDRLFAVAELRLAGPRNREQIVRIEKTEGAVR